MKKIVYTQEKMERVKERVQKMISIVRELEADFPGRPFTLDGHLVGSIGEVMAAYYYGIELYGASAKVHDGEIAERKVQIKITGQDKVVIKHEPEYLIVLYLRKNGEIFEVYNGPGAAPWNSASKKDSNNNCHMTVTKLMELDRFVMNVDRIPAIQSISKMKREFKNRKL